MDTATQVSPDNSPRRQRRSVEEKRAIVEQALTSGASVAAVARAHGINANQIFYWRKLYERGLLVRKVAKLAAGESNMPSVHLLPVKVEEERTIAPAVATEPPALTHGSIELKLPKAQIRITGVVDPVALRVALECLLR